MEILIIIAAIAAVYMFAMAVFDVGDDSDL